MLGGMEAKTPWLLGVLLLLTWLLLGLVLVRDLSPPPPRAQPEPGSDRVEVQRLRAELARYREAAAQPKDEAQSAAQDRRGDVREAAAATYDAETMRRWHSAILQAADNDERQRALSEVEAALHGNDTTRLLTALCALQGTERVAFDRARLREAVRPHLDSPVEKVRAAAYYALARLQPDPADMRAVQRGMTDPALSVRKAVTTLLVAVSKGDVSGPGASGIVAALLGDENREVVRSSIHGLLGATRFSDDIERTLIALGSADEFRDDVYEHVLFGIDGKSARVTDALVAIAQGPDLRLAERAIHSLRFGVPESRRMATADAMLRIANARTSPRVKRNCVELVETWGDSSHIPKLQELADTEDASTAVRNAVAHALTTIRNRELLQR